MSKDDARRKELASKFPEMEEHFQEIKEGIYDAPIEHLGETKKEQRQRNR